VLLENLKTIFLKDLKQHFNYSKSIYFEEEVIRDYIFKGYTIVYKIDIEKRTILVFGLIKYQKSIK
jgi:hypothetical protein